MRWGIIAGEFLIHDRRKFARRAFFCGVYWQDMYLYLCCK